jgi:diaminohydroxyphosphoribosylaminopyrimidine deaminase/5-amino-6-(5-phosphoribosylamino)uracil reductase
MARALELGRLAQGSVSPNPPVGAVLVKGGAIVGEGYTQPPGGPHAEIVALEAAGGLAAGAELYVTLEPCAHFGRTPPCADAVIRAGIVAVHAAIEDPDPRVNGEGMARLRAAGLRVETGAGAAEAARLLEGYLKHRRTGRPFVIAKFAMTLDGKIATASGDSRWVSGPESRAWAHEQRAHIDAILVGSGTVLADDPELTARPGGVMGPRQPLRVVADSTGRVPATAKVLQGPAKTLVVTTNGSSGAWRADIEHAGAKVLVLPDDGGHVDMGALMDELGRRGVLTLLVEGGGMLHGAFFDRRLVDKVEAFIAPKIVGGAGPGPVLGQGAGRMADALQLHDLSIERLGDDVLMIGYPRYPGEGVTGPAC